MGKGRIISDDGEGQYTIEVQYNRDFYDSRKAKLESNIEALEKQLQETTEYIDRQVIKLKITSCEKERESLSGDMPDDYSIDAWCADLTEEISGEVGTIEVPGEVGNIQIQPGFSGGQVYKKGRDGQLTPPGTLPASGAFYNLAMLPGWQKWKPLFRYATIDSINTDEDTADVTLEGIKSSQQNLNINQTETLSRVEIDYMDCNAGAFEEGDTVLVMFEGQDWSGPKIIGFKEEPKPCTARFFIRPFFNGDNAEKGGEEMRFSIPGIGGVQEKVYGDEHPPPPEFDLQDVRGMVGPFEMDRQAFDDFIEGPSVDVKLHDEENLYFSASTIAPSPGGILIDTVYKESPFGGAPPGTVQVRHLREQVVDMFATTKLLEGSESDITIEGVDYKCFEVAFTDLKLLESTPTKGGPFSIPVINVRDYGLGIDWQEQFGGGEIVPIASKHRYYIASGPFGLYERTDPELGRLYWTSTNCSEVPYQGSCSYGCCQPGKSAYWVDGVTGSEDYMKSKYIVTDENGQNPEFNSKTWNSSMRIMSQIILTSEVTGEALDCIKLTGPGMVILGEHPYCGAEFKDTVGYTYSMIPTPEDRF